MIGLGGFLLLREKPSREANRPLPKSRQDS